MTKLKGILLTQGMHGMISQVEGLAKALDLDFTHHTVETNNFWKIFPPKLTPISQKVFKKIDLIENNSDIYQCRWVNLKINNNHTPWLKNIDYLHLPIAHQEGKFIIPKDVINEIKNKNLISMQYANDNGKLANIKFPYNPNGSELDIAGLISKDGKVLAMMPHPERAFYYYHQPNWQELNKKNEYADGYKIFRNARNYFK